MILTIPNNKKHNHDNENNKINVYESSMIYSIDQIYFIALHVLKNRYFVN